MTDEELKKEFRDIKNALNDLKKQINNSANLPLLLTMQETAKVLNLSYRQIQRLIKAGQINCITVGRKIMIDAASIKHLLQ